MNYLETGQGNQMLTSLIAEPHPFDAVPVPGRENFVAMTNLL
jgi:hypothetical protein